MPAAQNTSNESRGVGARLAVGQHIENKMTARPQVFVYPPQNQRQLANSEEVIQRKGIRGRQIHLARQPQAPDVFEQEADVGRAAIARGNPEHFRRRINPKNRDSPTPAQIAREEPGPAAEPTRIGPVFSNTNVWHATLLPAASTSSGVLIPSLIPSGLLHLI